ncbi:1-deoxy-D-xylulose-5-phosphate reductoisomerase [Candidatus Sumerlaeota bacterium]|nr:1-deoxy-D-xylulose-5-phosphate reductoisomerase [Candidatus Sumerlaeota bacterium]
MSNKILILGSTGSIGTRTLDVARDFSEHFSVCGLSTYGQLDLLNRQIEEFHPAAINVTNPEKADDARALAERYEIRLTTGQAGLKELITLCEPDIVVTATVGIAGLEPTLFALEQGCDVALANKEVLVTGGALVMKKARKKGVRIRPIDSEHNAVAQCLMGQSLSKLRRIILTASGGPFRKLSKEELGRVTPEQALTHPTWKMGNKITIDSATLMNKGFEVIEGHHLFDLPIDQIEVAIHPQSVIHSLVEFVDGSLLAQLSVTDMYLTIQSALFYPERYENGVKPLDLCSLNALTFEKPDLERFPCLSYAYEAIREGGTATVALNAANEIAVRRFLDKEISFMQIPQIIRGTLDKHKTISDPDLGEILEADRNSRETAKSL